MKKNKKLVKYVKQLEEKNNVLRATIDFYSSLLKLMDCYNKVSYTDFDIKFDLTF